MKAASPGSCLCPQVCRLSSPMVHIAAHETVHPAYHCLGICIRSIFKQLNCFFRNSLWEQTRRLLFISCFMTVFGKQRIRQLHLASPSSSCVSFYCLSLLLPCCQCTPTCFTMHPQILLLPPPGCLHQPLHVDTSLAARARWL